MKFAYYNYWKFYKNLLENNSHKQQNLLLTNNNIMIIIFQLFKYENI